jgi:pyruvate ferredoxin oxidoreductase gamma subunit
MFQVRIHGRGGQGVVSAAEMLSMAAFEEGRYAQAFPSFGSERMGAPVAAFCRIRLIDIKAFSGHTHNNPIVPVDSSGSRHRNVVDTGFGVVPLRLVSTPTL